MHQISDKFLTSVPEDQKEALAKIIEWIEQHIPYDDVIIPNGFPVYTINEQWIAGCATRKKGPMFYLMLHEILDKHEVELGKLRTGKSCVAYKTTTSLSHKELDQLIITMLQEASSMFR